MITEKVSTLKIHKLTQAQYERELAAGRLDEKAIYLTPDEDVDLSDYMTEEEVKAYIDTQLGDISSALDNIIALQNSLIGGESE